MGLWVPELVAGKGPEYRQGVQSPSPSSSNSRPSFSHHHGGFVPANAGATQDGRRCRFEGQQLFLLN